MLSDEMKAERVRISRKLLERFEKQGEDFLKTIITGDETWVHHYDPENKRQSMEYRHKEPPHVITYLLTYLLTYSLTHSLTHSMVQCPS